MKAEIEERIEYVLRMNEEEARYIKTLVNCAPSELAKTVLTGRYTADEIVRITNHAKRNSMWEVMTEVV